MFPQLILFLAFYSLTVHAADVLTFKIADFQGNMLDLSSGSPNSLTPVQSFKNTNETRQNAVFQWKFFYAARGDENEYRVQNVAAPASILSYTTADITTPGGAEHTQIVGKQNVSTFWDIMPVAGKKGFSNFIEKESRLAMTAWPVGSGSSRSSPITLEQYDAKNPHQVFKLVARLSNFIPASKAHGS